MAMEASERLRKIRAEGRTVRALMGSLANPRWCLDFTNTVAVHDGRSPYDYLRGYADLVAWSQQAGLRTEREAETLRQREARRPAAAGAVLREARALREAIYRLLAAQTRGAVPPVADLAVLNGTLSRALVHARLEPAAEAIAWAWEAAEDALDAMLWPVATSAAALLASDEVKRVRECAGRDCAWLFLDTTKNHSRRYCRAEGCGNRARARRHYARTRAAVAPAVT